MKLLPLTPELAGSLKGRARKISKQLQQEVTTQPAEFDTLIILGNGDPDDRALLVICHHLNGAKTAAITKPKYTRTAVLEHLPTYILHLKNVKNIVVILDQEDDPLNQLNSQIERKLREKTCSHKPIHEEERLRQYDCTLANRNFTLTIVINGLDTPYAEKHNIEEHLTHAATKLNIIKPPTQKTDTKQLWTKLRQKQPQILKTLYTQKTLCQETFPQHWKALSKIAEK